MHGTHLLEEGPVACMPRQCAELELHRADLVFHIELTLKCCGCGGGWARGLAGNDGHPIQTTATLPQPDDPTQRKI